MALSSRQNCPVHSQAVDLACEVSLHGRKPFLVRSTPMIVGITAIGVPAVSDPGAHISNKRRQCFCTQHCPSYDRPTCNCLRHHDKRSAHTSSKNASAHIATRSIPAPSEWTVSFHHHVDRAARTARRGQNGQSLRIRARKFCRAISDLHGPLKIAKSLKRCAPGRAATVRVAAATARSWSTVIGSGASWGW